MTPAKTAIIAALERELHPLVRGWTKSPLKCNEHTLWVYRSGEVVAVAAGIGCRRAEVAARRLLKEFRPQVLISAGLAGALISSLKVGSIVTPNVVVDATSGAKYRCSVSGGVLGGSVLVSAEEIAGKDSKRGLVERFHALLVDMEAAGVARVAQESNIVFRCVKVISDELDFAIPPLNQFVDGQGSLSTSKFASWAVLRPGYWTTIMRLARNSRRAIHALCGWLRQNVIGEASADAVVTLEGLE